MPDYTRRPTWDVKKNPITCRVAVNQHHQADVCRPFPGRSNGQSRCKPSVASFFPLLLLFGANAEREPKRNFCSESPGAATVTNWILLALPRVRYHPESLFFSGSRIRDKGARPIRNVAMRGSTPMQDLAARVLRCHRSATATATPLSSASSRLGQGPFLAATGRHFPAASRCFSVLQPRVQHL